MQRGINRILITLGIMENARARDEAYANDSRLLHVLLITGIVLGLYASVVHGQDEEEEYQAFDPGGGYEYQDGYGDGYGTGDDSGDTGGYGDDYGPGGGSGDDFDDRQEAPFERQDEGDPYEPQPWEEGDLDRGADRDDPYAPYRQEEGSPYPQEGEGNPYEPQPREEGSPYPQEGEGNPYEPQPREEGSPYPQEGEGNPYASQPREEGSPYQKNQPVTNGGNKYDRARFEALYKKANGYYMQGQFREAIAVFSDINKHATSKAIERTAMWNMAVCYRKLYERDRRITDGQQAMAYAKRALAYYQPGGDEKEQEARQKSLRWIRELESKLKQDVIPR